MYRKCHPALLHVMHTVRSPHRQHVLQLARGVAKAVQDAILSQAVQVIPTGRHATLHKLATCALAGLKALDDLRVEKRAEGGGCYFTHMVVTRMLARGQQGNRSKSNTER